MDNNERYKVAFEAFKSRIEEGDLRGSDAMQAFVDTTHMDSATGLPHFWWCGVYLLSENDEREGEPELTLAAGSSPATSPLIIKKRSGGACCDCILLEKPIVVPDIGCYHGHVACDINSKSEVVVPIFNSQWEIAGVIDVDNNKAGSFTWDDTDWLSRFAEHLGARL